MTDLHIVTFPDLSIDRLLLWEATSAPTYVVATNHEKAGWQIIKYADTKETAEFHLKRIKDPKIWVDITDQMRRTAIILPVESKP